MSKDRKLEMFSITAAFTDELIKLISPKTGLKFCISNFSVFDSITTSFRTVVGLDWDSKIQRGSKYDFILGDLRIVSIDLPKQHLSRTLKTERSWQEIFKSLKLLSDNGLAFYFLEENCLSTSDGKIFENTLNSEGYFVNAILDSSNDPKTPSTPILVIISKTHKDSIFIAELLNESQASEIAKNFCSGIFAKDLTKGMKIDRKAFYGFHRFKIKQQIEKLETQYKEFEGYTIERIAKEINQAKYGENLIEKENSIYIPVRPVHYIHYSQENESLGNTLVVSSLSDTITEHHNYFQVVLAEKAINGYVVAFFRSNLGKLILQSLASGSPFFSISKNDLEQAEIALPSPDDQKQIMVTQHKLRELKQAIDSFDGELALNPTSSKSILAQLDSMLEAIGGLTDADEVLNIIRQGESKRIEYKETLSLDVQKQTKEKYIELSALKTIVAFLNTEGGTLLVGVADNGEITGVDLEIEKFHKQNTDKFLLHTKNLIKARIGEEYYPYIDYKLVEINGQKVLMVKCKESESPCYLDNAEFYIRTNPATDKLEGPKLVQYVKNHFGK